MTGLNPNIASRVDTRIAQFFTPERKLQGRQNIDAVSVSDVNSIIGGYIPVGTDHSVARYDGTNKLQGSLVTIDDNGNLTANSVISGPLGVKLTTSNIDEWLIYKLNSSDRRLFVRDVVNSRSHITLIPGVDASGANTHLNSKVTVESDIQIGGATGPRIKNNAGVIELRNSADSSFSDIRTGNLTINSRALFANNVWHRSIDGVDRLLFATSGETYIKSGAVSSGVLGDWRDSDNLTMFRVMSTRGIETNYYRLGIGSGPLIKGSGNDVIFRNNSDNGETSVKALSYITNNFTISSTSVDQGVHGKYLLVTEDVSSVVHPAKVQIGTGSMIRSIGTGSYALPGRSELLFVTAVGNTTHPDSQMTAGSLEGRTYTANSASADLILWANPNVTIKDRSNHTLDLVLRGGTGNVEINRGRLILANDIQLGGSTGPRIKNTGSLIQFRNSSDTSDSPIVASAGTLNGILTTNGLMIPNGGISWSSSQVITNASSQISLTSTNTGAQGGVRILTTNDAGVSGQLATYGSASTSPGLANKVLLSSTGSLRIASSSGSQSSGSDSIEISAGGYNRVSAVFHANSDFQIGGKFLFSSDGPLVRRSGSSIQFRNNADSDDAGISAGAGTFNGAITGFGGAVFSSSVNYNSAGAVIEMISSNTGNLAGARFKATSADGQYGCLTHYNNTATTAIGGKTVLESTVGIRISSERFTSSGGTLPIEFSPGGRDMLSVTMPAEGGLLINRGGGPQITGSTTRTKVLGIQNSVYSDVYLFQHGWFLGQVAYGASFLFNAKQPTETTSRSFNETRYELPKRTNNNNSPVVWHQSRHRNASFEVLAAPTGVVDTDIANEDWASQFSVHRTTGNITIGVGTLSINNDIILTGDRRVIWDTASLRVHTASGELSVWGPGSSNQSAGFKCKQLLIGGSYALTGNDEGLRVVGMATFNSGVQLGSLSTGPKLLDKSGVITARNTADTADVGIAASTGTFSGVITSGFQTITDDSQVTTAILLPGQSRLFYNSTSDTLSTWTNVGGKLYKSQPHVEV